MITKLVSFNRIYQIVKLFLELEGLLNDKVKGIFDSI